jgi:Rieske Fe-S protein
MAISRRRFAKVAFLGGLAAASAGGIGAIINYLYPRNADRRLTTLTIVAKDVPQPGGEPLLNKDFNFLLVNISQAEVESGIAGVRTAGLLALSRVCPHLRCTSNWDPEFTWTSPMTGAPVTGHITCVCHDSFFTRAGKRVFGPSPRGLDTMRLSKRTDRVMVHVTEVRQRDREPGVEGFDEDVEPLPWP